MGLLSDELIIITINDISSQVDLDEAVSRLRMSKFSNQVFVVYGGEGQELFDLFMGYGRMTLKVAIDAVIEKKQLEYDSCK